MNATEKSEPLWRPPESRKKVAHLRQFMKLAAEQAGTRIDSYHKLHHWSVTQPESFWRLVWSFGGIIAAEEAERILVGAQSMPGARWFEGARLNFAENLLRHSHDGPALVHYDERGERTVLTWAELNRQVASLAAHLRDWGIQPGDRVAALLPNQPETIVAMLAATSIGATWSSCSPEFGADGVLDRFGQIQPVVVLFTDAYSYAGKRFNIRPVIRRLIDELPAVRHWVHVGAGSGLQVPDLPPSTVGFHDLMQRHDALRFALLPFDHPLYIMYSSGTTGAPKCIVHGAGGTLLQHMKEHLLHVDLHAGDRFFYFTTCGWMMWNWLVSGLATGATLILYDGAPMYPDPGALWRLAEHEKINVFGTSAKYLGALEKAGYRPGRQHDLGALQTILSTGSPLAHESYDFVYRDIKPDVLLSSISGGTDIISCFALGNPLLPVYRGELQCRGLGMKVEVFDDNGTSVTGEKGELVCTAPFPSMPLGFFNDPDGARYRAAYFERFANTWCHGDYAEITEHEGLVIHGRSDTVLNPGGVRIGTAEIYRVVEQVAGIAESIVIGQEWENDIRIVLFVRMQVGCELNDNVADAIRTAVRNQASPRHVPARIVEVDDIPRTISGKLVELAVRNVVHGRPVKNTAALANPESLAQYRDRPELAV